MRWLARNAAAVRRLYVNEAATAAACASLVTCLPALEQVQLHLSGRPLPGGLGRLLEALATCPRLNSLDLLLIDRDGSRKHPNWMLSSLGPVAQLRSLTQLTLEFYNVGFYPLADVVRALVPLTGLVKLTVGLSQPIVVPAALGQLKALQSLKFNYFEDCVLEAGCFDLPNLLSLVFEFCHIESAEVFASVPALPSLTHIEFANGFGPPFIAQLLKLPRLQHLIFGTDEPCVADYSDAYLGLPRLPADMSLKLLRLSLAGHGLDQFPMVVMQLVALEHLDMCGNGFAELPIAITALSRLTELILGRVLHMHEQLPLDVRALGDLSAFPALCTLEFCNCEVVLAASLLGVTRHASLKTLDFHCADPAPECAPMVLQLSQALKQLGRGSVVVW